MRKLLFMTIVGGLLLSYILSERGQIKIRTFAENKFNQIVSEITGKPFNGLEHIFDDLLPEIKIPM